MRPFYQIRRVSQHQPIQGLQGYTVVRNALVNDYAVRECVDSMLACCEKVLVCDSDSTDGTREMLDRWADNEPRLTIINYPWPNPKGDSKWFTKWLNFARERLTLPMQLELDADEVLEDRPSCHARIRQAVERQESLTVTRLNYWKDARHIIPQGHCCGKEVVRVGRSCDWMPSDEGGYGRGQLPILDNAVNATSEVFIHHIGFLRRTDAFYKKARVVLAGFFNEFDKRLEPLEKEQRPVHEVQNCEWTNSLDAYDGYLPDAVQRWLADRGHDVPDYLPALPPKNEPPITLEKPKERETLNIRICGDFGDIVAALAVAKAYGDVNLYCVDRGICKALLPRLGVIQPFLEALPFVKLVKPHEGEPIHWDASDFRTRHQWTHSLHKSHLLHYRSQTHLPPIGPDFRKPWITGIKPDSRATGKIIIHRTSRYNNDSFPWAKIVEKYRDTLLMVGTQEEHRSFVQQFGQVPFIATANLLETAQLIAASSLVIAGQSCVLAIAEGMKKPRIAEMSLSQPDVIVALAADVQYVADGNVRMPDGTFISSVSMDWQNINTSISPPGGWRHPDMACRPMHINAAISSLMGIKGLGREEARVSIIRHNVERCPDFYSNSSSKSSMHAYNLAIQNAQPA